MTTTTRHGAAHRRAPGSGLLLCGLLGGLVLTLTGFIVLLTTIARSIGP